jgi:hypothetical protein
MDEQEKNHKLTHPPGSKTAIPGTIIVLQFFLFFIIHFKYSKFYI